MGAGEGWTRARLSPMGSRGSADYEVPPDGKLPLTVGEALGERLLEMADALRSVLTGRPEAPSSDFTGEPDF